MAIPLSFHGMYLLLPALGRGVGRDLLSQVTEQLRAAGYLRAVLWVLRANARARRFYEATGWRWDGTVVVHAFDGEERSVVRYVIAFG